MAADDTRAEPIEVAGELHACPRCDYTNGFHVAFVREADGDALRLELICPSCSARFNLNRCI
ncbi:MAG: hypothetical protein QGG42_05625 [Phycisphaerae bacterium]|jgi:uncharacterized protein YbaR (Trm112 family)|nr:hypothetical protein [Phycisphaerae bacterium]